MRDGEHVAALFDWRALAGGEARTIGEGRLSRFPSGPETDAALLRRIAEGDASALTELYAIHGGRMHAFACRLTGGGAAAEDVLQESLLAVWKNARRYRGDGRVLAWLLGIVHHKAMDAVGGRRPAVLPEDAEDVLPSADPEPDERFMRRERSAILKEGLERLPLPQKSVLDLVFFHGLSLEETAAVCGCPVGTVKSRLNGAKAGLRRILEADGLDAEVLR